MKRLCFLLMFLCWSATASAAPNVGSADAVYCGGSIPATVKFANLEAEGAGNHTIVAAVSGKKIRVIGFGVGPVGADSGYVEFRDGTAGDVLEGAIYFGRTNQSGIASPDVGDKEAATGFAARNCYPFGCFEASANTLLSVDVSDASGSGFNVNVSVAYLECD